MMDLTWYALGILSGVSVLVLRHISSRFTLTWLTWGGLITGIFLTLFCIAWAVGAILEGVPRAASMGLLLFGLGGVVHLSLTGRMILSQNRDGAGE